MFPAITTKIGKGVQKWTLFLCYVIQVVRPCPIMFSATLCIFLLSGVFLAVPIPIGRTKLGFGVDFCSFTVITLPNNKFQSKKLNTR
jgi:hypothetical protein